MVAGDGHDIALLSPVEADPHLRPGADVEGGRRGGGVRGSSSPAGKRTNAPSRSSSGISSQTGRPSTST
ncbi:hypothetical protein [Methanoculleus chikugoensis]|uniref:hypothetical protein n=1 Tax=Methanoculleus chikugoensis TaxID=118126 RepID=UPI001FB36B2D|nr:hypothetical protein [Methanoculleus chikugoensis]